MGPTRPMRTDQPTILDLIFGWWTSPMQYCVWWLRMNELNDCITLTDFCFSLQSPLRRMRAGNLYLNCFLYRLVFPPAFTTVTYCVFIKFLTAVEPCLILCPGMSCLGFAFYFRFTCAWRWWLFRWNIYASLTHVHSVLIMNSSRPLKIPDESTAWITDQ